MLNKMSTTNQKVLMNSINRRKFIKGSALLVGGIASCNLPAEKSAFVNPTEKKLKLSLIGCGGRGTGALINALTADKKLPGKDIGKIDIFDRLSYVAIARPQVKQALKILS